MPTLLIEHAISDFGVWHTAFMRFASRRADSGVLHERILQPEGDPNHVLVDLEFGTLDEARGFRQFLETEVWSTPANSPALVGSPSARLMQVVQPG